MPPRALHPAGIILSAVFAVVLAGCSNAPTCSDPDVLKTVKTLHDKQELGQFIQAPEVFKVQEKSATLTSTQAGVSKCSVLITMDILEIMKGSGTSEADLSKMRLEGPKKGLALTKEYLVNYTVLPMASGQNYVTVLP